MTFATGIDAFTNAIAASTVVLPPTEHAPPNVIDRTVSSVGQKAIDQKPVMQLKSPIFAISVLKYSSIIGTVAAVAILVSGLVLNMLGIAAVGGLFTVTSLIGLYYSKELAYLKDIDELNKQLVLSNEIRSKLQLENHDLLEREKNLLAQMSQADNQYEKVAEEHAKVIKAYEEKLKGLDEQLKDTVENMAKVAAAQKDDLLKINKGLKDELAILLTENQQLVKEGDTLKADLKLAKTEVDHLHTELEKLNTHLTEYKKLNDQFSQSVASLQKQLHDLEAKKPTIDPQKEAQDETERERQIEEEIKKNAHIHDVIEAAKHALEDN
jgi:hypothetical protein